jgi:hypothetical protein
MRQARKDHLSVARTAATAGPRRDHPKPKRHTWRALPRRGFQATVIAQQRGAKTAVQQLQDRLKRPERLAQVTPELG